MNRVSCLLSSYGATLSTLDINIYDQIFLIDEQSSILKFQTFIWGKSARDYYASVNDTRFTLFQVPKFNHVFGQYQKDMMMKTLREFPIDLKLDPTSDYPDKPDLYDPRFILISLYHLLGPENPINCNQIIKSLGISFALVGTSSDDEAMRHLSYLVLERFVFHLEASKSSAAIYFWVHFIDCFRATMKSPNQRMPFLLTSLLVRMIDTIEQPQDSLFFIMKDFVSEPKFDSNQISSLFINLLTSKDLEWKKSQRLVLNLLAYSVRDQADFDIIASGNLINLILSIFTSKWVDWLDKILIIKFIKNCVQLPQAFKMLVIENELIVWLTSIVMLLYSSMGLSQREEVADLVKLIGLSFKSTDLPKSISKQSGLIKSVIKAINQEPVPEEI